MIDRFTRCLAAVTLVVALAATGCGVDRTAGISTAPSAPPPVGVKAAQLVGWWFFHDIADTPVEYDYVHIVRSGGELRMAFGGAADDLRILRPQADTWVAVPTAYDPRHMVVWATATGKLWFAVTESDGKTYRAGYAEGTRDQICDELTRENIEALDAAIQEWHEQTGEYPVPRDVRPGQGGFSASLSPWPTNPFTGDDMVPGTDPGDFRYRRLANSGYRLQGITSAKRSFTAGTWGSE
jgi:hypothetical protein